MSKINLQSHLPNIKSRLATRIARDLAFLTARYVCAAKEVIRVKAVLNVNVEVSSVLFLYSFAFF